MDRPPYIDELVVVTEVPAGRLWEGLVTAVPRMSVGARGLAWLLGCEPAVATSMFTGAPGDAFPGFRVVDAEPGRRLVLGGQHRFSRYRLEFVVDDGQLRARTFAAFGGIKGRLYRAAVISTGAHRVATRYWMHRIVKLAMIA